jgi:hypothetical protein
VDEFDAKAKEHETEQAQLADSGVMMLGAGQGLILVHSFAQPEPFRH